MGKGSILAVAWFFMTLASWAVEKDLSAPTPPLIPAGFADAQGTMGFFANPDGGIDAVELATGRPLWKNRQGQWPLLTRYGWLAVASTGGSLKGALCVRFLNPSDGRLLVETGPITIKGLNFLMQDGIGDENGVAWGNRNGGMSIAAWSPPPSRNPADRSPHAGWLQLHWDAQSFYLSGIQPPRSNGNRLSGILWINPSNGKAEREPEAVVPHFGPSEPTLPKEWKRDLHFSYWNWSRYGSSWSDKPRPFHVTGGVDGFFSHETKTQLVLLNRWRPLEPLAPVTITGEPETVPTICLESRYTVLTSYKNGKNQAKLLDLVRAGNPGSLVDLPWFREGFRFPPSVVGPLLFYVVEDRGPDGTVKTTIHRNLIALDWAKGKEAWSHPLAPRFEYPPIAMSIPGTNH